MSVCPILVPHVSTYSTSTHVRPLARGFRVSSPPPVSHLKCPVGPQSHYLSEYITSYLGRYGFQHTLFTPSLFRYAMAHDYFACICIFISSPPSPSFLRELIWTHATTPQGAVAEAVVLAVVVVTLCTHSKKWAGCLSLHSNEPLTKSRPVPACSTAQKKTRTKQFFFVGKVRFPFFPCSRELGVRQLIRIPRLFTDA